jgi:PhnB protein
VAARQCSVARARAPAVPAAILLASVAGVPLPDGYHSVNPYILVDGVERLIAFLIDVFGAVEQGEREIRADGSIGHADVRIGDSLVMLSNATAEFPARPCVNFVYIDDVDSAFERAIRAGATPIVNPSEQPWGDRVGGFHDPFDNRWWVATHLKDLPTSAEVPLGPSER